MNLLKYVEHCYLAFILKIVVATQPECAPKQLKLSGKLEHYDRSCNSSVRANPLINYKLRA